MIIDAENVSFRTDKNKLISLSDILEAYKKIKGLMKNN